MRNFSKRVLIIVCIYVTIIIPSPTQIFAADFSAPNNKYGIHLAQPSDEDITRAQDLVNSSGGKWGYITLVIPENDRDKDKWQGIMNQLRERQLIPIIRIATKGEGSSWKRPKPEEAQEWATFLNSLNWVVKNRYVILFNEPNHATEWGGTVDPKSFAEVNREFAKKLKETNKDFFIMMGGMDAAAPSQMPKYEDSGKFLSAVMEVIPSEEYNQLFDGLSSHSYPNPGFVGSPQSNGKATIRGYQWELDHLKSFGVKDLPVFITETGWHGGSLAREKVAENFKIAFEEVWGPDDRVVAITPFVLNYQSEPFLQFSWLKKDTNEPYPEYEMVKGLSKQVGVPEFIEGGDIIHNLPTEMVAQSTFHFHFKMKNTGQAIWREDDNYRLVIEGIDNGRYLVSSIGKIKPNEDRKIDMFFTTGAESGKKTSRIALYRGDKKIIESKPWTYQVVPLPALTINASLFPKISSNGEDFELQVFDEHEELVFKQKKINIKNGKGFIPKVENIALNRKYRLVILRKFYLPTQTYITFKKGTNEIRFKRMLPLDANGDGNLTFDDSWEIFRNPGIIGKWFPW